ncbi:MAG: AAA family ATPase, partial [Anaerolineales bacterium]|nr:AAA family ATPase [Anaerolineales bacterium]
IQFVAIFWFMSQTKMETIRPEDAKSVTFKEYWGQPTLVNLVKQWISLLSDREQFVRMGGKYINGILLYGPPGTGKTMLAKAMAGEAGIPFISVEGSGFRGMFWGVDVLRMMQFVGKAKKLAREYGACIAYIDEIDAVGMSRGGVMGGAGGMMGGMGGMMGGFSGALTRLLYEMDGIEDKRWHERLRDRWYGFIGKETPKRHWHVLFMGSTNRPDVLDPALLRPGRFDQKINVDPPDKAGRREVIRGYLTKIKHDDTVDIEAIVEDTPHTTPAQIASAITKDAVRIALFKGRDRISQRDIDQALQEQFLGIEQPIEEMDPEQRRQVAYHEAGHAVAQHYLMPDQRIVRVSIVRRGGAYGYMLPVDRVEVYVEPLRRIAADIMVSMAGHVGVKLATGEYWTGAFGDNRNIRWNIWRLYTLGYFGPPVLGAENGGTNGVPPSATPLIERFWKTLEEQTENLLRAHFGELEAITQALLEKNDLSHDEVMEYLGDNGWRPTGSIVAARRSAQLPAARLPLPEPAPAPAAAVEAIPSQPAPAEPPAAEANRETGSAVVAPAPAPRQAPARMMPPPRPEDLARRPAPEPAPAPAKDEPAEKKDAQP